MAFLSPKERVGALSSGSFLSSGLLCPPFSSFSSANQDESWFLQNNGVFLHVYLPDPSDIEGKIRSQTTYFVRTMSEPC